MSFEAINHAGSIQKEIIVILNDNEMSISKNVGALQTYLTNVLVSQSYNTLKNKVWTLSQSLPTFLRRRFITSVQKLEESLINILVPNIIFEDLGFKYIGPVDGHNIPRLVRILNKTRRNVVGPVLIHVVTQKGKGYEFAEEDAQKFHGVGPYEPDTGTLEKKGVKAKDRSYSKVFGDKLVKLAKDNKDIVAITAAMAYGTGLSGFENKYPERFFDVGIAEQHCVTFAGGLAISGKKPFVAIYSTFMQRAFDQIIHDVALQNLPVVFCLDRAGLVGEDGATHHGVFDLSYLKLIPNLIIMAPTCADEFEQMIEFAAEWKSGPIAIRYPRGNAVQPARKLPDLEIGKAEILNQGSEIAILATGKDLLTGIELRKLLIKSNKKLKPMLINPRFVKPIDTDLLDTLPESVNLIITIEDNALPGGFGESVKSCLCNKAVNVLSFGIPDEFVVHGETDLLRERLNLLPEQIFEQIKPHLDFKK